MPNEGLAVRCNCGFLIGYATADIEGTISCIYCVAERRTFRAYFGGAREENSDLFVYSNTDDKTPWRRGLMFDRKIAIREWYELCEEIKDTKHE